MARALEIALLAGARVLATTSDEAKARRAREAGAELVVDYRTEDVGQAVRRHTAKRGVDVVVDLVGEKTWMTSLRAAAKGGRIVTCGATSGPSPKEDIRLIFWRQLSILGSTMANDREFRTLLRRRRGRAAQAPRRPDLPVLAGARGLRPDGSGRSTARSSSCRTARLPTGPTGTEPERFAGCRNRSAPEQPEQQRRQQREQQARHDRKRQGPALPAHDDVAGKPAEVARQDRPRQADRQKRGSEGQEHRPPRGLYGPVHPCDYDRVLPGRGRFSAGDEP